MKELEKIYNPKQVEDRIYQEWMEKKYFHTEIDKEKELEKKQKILEEKQKSRERRISIILSFFGILAIISTVLDSLNLMKWLYDNRNHLRTGHFIILIVASIVTVVAIGALVVSLFDKDE